jgi:hypothetical protein
MLSQTVAALRSPLRQLFTGLDGSGDRVTTPTHLFANEDNRAAVFAWFEQFGLSDWNYFRNHYDRLKVTKHFALAGIRERLTILNVGAHWLHEAFFYANDGHKLHCVDAPNVMEEPSVVSAAKAMNATLHIAGHLDLGDGISELPDSSIDLVVFCEILEHLSFNPLLLWKQIYRVMREGASIVLTTPNAARSPNIERNAERLARGEWGPTVEEILTTGTYGHHWKEYTAAEVLEYFERMSPDFCCTVLPSAPERIFAKINLPSKQHGITLSPPWIVRYA